MNDLEDKDLTDADIVTASIQEIQLIIKPNGDITVEVNVSGSWVESLRAVCDPGKLTVKNATAAQIYCAWVSQDNEDES